MKNKILLLRISYWLGAILDFLTIIPMLNAKVGAAMFGIANFNPGNDYRYAMGVGASLMLGWTFLLIWADRKPLERKGVLILTICPVMLGLIASGTYAVISNLVSINYMLPVLIFQIFIITFFAYSYFRNSH